MIKAIIFDCFGVLVTEGWYQFLDEFLSDDRERRREARNLSKQLNIGALDYNSFVREVAEQAGVSIQKVQEFLDDNRPNEQLFEVIKRLKPRYKIGMLSNAGDDWLAELFTEEQLKLFDDIVLSFRYGMVKPDHAIYELALKRLDVNPGETLFIDDAERHCAGAKEVGMKTILYKNFAQFKEELEELLA